ncbi:MAG: PEP-CTERM sorting domain-containing protein [Planctomycetota bacterium]
MHHLGSTTAKLLLLVCIALHGQVQAAGIKPLIIDSFVAAQDLSAPFDQTVNTSGDDILGGTRTATTFSLDPNDRWTAANGVGTWSVVPGGFDANMNLRYDANDVPLGLDLTALGLDSVAIEILSVSPGVSASGPQFNINLTTLDGSSDDVRSTYTTGVLGPGVYVFDIADLFTPQQRPVDETQIDIISVQISGSPGQSIQLGSIYFVPEPTSLALLGLGGLLITRRRRRIR